EETLRHPARSRQALHRGSPSQLADSTLVDSPRRSGNPPGGAPRERGGKAPEKAADFAKEEGFGSRRDGRRRQTGEQAKGPSGRGRPPETREGTAAIQV
ncbi:hypothetical protein HK102_011980, partial [Quaeritorhiza haematococci]